MCDQRYDITYDDLNPTFLYAWKGHKQESDSYHCHDYTEILYLVSGELYYLIEGETIKAGPGDIIVLNPKTRHRCSVTEAKTAAVLFCMGFCDYQFRGMERDQIHLNKQPYILHTDTQLRQKLNQLCQNMASENTLNQPGTYFMLKSYLIQFLLLIIREQIEPSEMKHHFEFKSFNRTYIVEQIIDFFQEHYNEKISLDQIARNMYLSPFYISKIFKNETGETPINYLIRIRLDKARNYLETEKITNIKEIAAAVGYDDVYHFSKLFKKKFGITPTQYKKDN